MVNLSQFFLKQIPGIFMQNIDIVITTAINSLAGSNALLDAFMTSVTYFGVPCLVLWVVLQWWVNENRRYRMLISTEK